MFINGSILNEGGLNSNPKNVRQQSFSEGKSLRTNLVQANITEWKAEKRKLRTNLKWEKLRQ